MENSNQMNFDDVKFHHNIDDMESLCRQLSKMDSETRVRIMENKDYYKREIIELVEKINNPEILMKIYTVVKTHLEIVKEKEQKD